MFARGLFLCLARVLVQFFPECLPKPLNKRLYLAPNYGRLVAEKSKGIRGL